jgi:hypothetical protein
MELAGYRKYVQYVTDSNKHTLWITLYYYDIGKSTLFKHKYQLLLALLTLKLSSMTSTARVPDSTRSNLSCRN